MTEALPFPDQLEAAANDIDALSNHQIQGLLRRAALRLRERDKALAEVRARIVTVIAELPEEPK